MVENYATGTEFIHRENLSLVSCWTVGIDFGFSGIKGFAPNKTFCFPNCAVPLTNEAYSSMLDSEDNDIYIRDGNGIWAVGEKALGVISPENAMNYESEMYDRNRYESPIFKTLVKVGLGIAIASNEIRQYRGEPIQIQTGLPPKYRELDTELLVEAIAGDYDFEMRIGSSPFQRYVFTIPEKNVHVMDQPTGSLFSVITANDGTHGPTDLSLFKANTVVFDPGFKTLDVYDMSAGLFKQSNTFDSLGMYEIFKRTVEEVRRVYHSNVTIPGMQQALRRGYVTSFDRKHMRSEQVKFDEILYKHTKQVCTEAIEKLNSITNYLQNHDFLIVTGGTGNVWYAQIADFYKNMQSLKILSGNRYDPSLSNTYSNVRGYYLHIVNVMAKRAGGAVNG